MNTVKLHWIQTLINDPFTKDTYAIENSDFYTVENSHVHEAEEYILPEGYTIGETVAGEIAIFDNNNKYCELDRFRNSPRLSSSSRVVLLEKVK